MAATSAGYCLCLVGLHRCLCDVLSDDLVSICEWTSKSLTKGSILTFAISLHRFNFYSFAQFISKQLLYDV